MSRRTWQWFLLVGLGALGGCGGDDDAPPEAELDALVTTSDFTSGGLGWIDRDGVGHVAEGMADDQDSAPAFARNVPLVLQHGTGMIDVLDGAAMPSVLRTIDVNPAGAMPPYAANPQQVVSVAADRAYVSRLAVSSLAVIDPRPEGTGNVAAEIDLSSLAGAMDTDSVDASAMALADGRVFVALGRYRFDEMFAIHFDDGSVLAVIDPDTDAVTGMVELMGDNPTAIIHDEARNRLLVHDHGDFFALDGGIEAIDLGTTASSGMVLEEMAGGAEINALVHGGGATAWVIAGDVVRKLDLATDTLGDTLDVPMATGLAVGGDTLYVISPAGVHAFGAQDGSPRTPASGPWTFGSLPVYGVAGAP